MNGSDGRGHVVTGNFGVPEVRMETLLSDLGIQVRYQKSTP